jgi:hypothetical protein
MAKVEVYMQALGNVKTHKELLSIFQACETIWAEKSKKVGKSCQCTPCVLMRFMDAFDARWNETIVSDST